MFLRTDRVVRPFASLKQLRTTAVAPKPTFGKSQPPSVPRRAVQPSVSLRGLRTTSRVFSEKKDQEPQEAEIVGEKDEKEETEAEEEKVPDQLIDETETVVGQKQHMSFQAETRKLLDIVTRSLYAEKEVFIRELVSNGSDALEKLRQLETEGKDFSDKHLDKEILISCDESKNVITIQDFGIGMTKDELVKNLGTIAHSGSLKYLNDMKEKSVTVDNIIGQFGVGFYSLFMVAQEVKVYSRHALESGNKGHVWISDGSGAFDVAEADGVTRGTKIIIHLKDDNTEFAKKHIVDNIIKKYSNFVGFPIKVNGTRVNTVEALWTIPKSQVTPEQHKQFYQFIAHAYDDPMYTIHYTTDSPLNIRSIFYIPEQHVEKYGMGRLEPGVNLYSRKVLIQPKAKTLFPEWMRFIKGVVDSEDLPLNVSREYLQDSALIKKVGTVLTRKILRFMEEEANKDPAKYTKFYKEYENFFKEGICTDFRWKDELSRLLRFSSTGLPEGELTSLDEYVKRMKADQKDIFYLSAPSRDFVESSPFYEVFKEKGYEVLLLPHQIDEFVMNQIAQFNDKKLVSIETAKVEKTEKSESAKVSPTETTDLLAWFEKLLGSKVSSVKETKLAISAPAVVVDFESATYRKMMRFVDPNRAKELPKQVLELNTSHPVILRLNTIRTMKPDLAKMVAEQIFDNALISAGLVDDSRSMLPRLNSILEMALAEK